METIGREMRRKERAMEQEECIDFLKKVDVGRLGLTDGDVSYVVPFNFVYYEGKIYIHCAEEGLKIDLIRRYNRVCFEADEFRGVKKGKRACNYIALYESIIAFGRAGFIHSEEKKRRVLTRLMEKYAHGESHGEIDSEELSDVTIIEISIDKITGKRTDVH